MSFDRNIEELKWTSRLQFQDFQGRVAELGGSIADFGLSSGGDEGVRPGAFPHQAAKLSQLWTHGSRQATPEVPEVELWQMPPWML
jgi:hypothetical protein